MPGSPKQRKVVIVGAGPVGSLAALYAAARGDHVELYELRGDLRDPSTVPLNFTKSINLAISERGIHSMKSSNRPEFVQQILREAIPMHGRMIHGRAKNGSLWEDAQAYDIHGRHINAIDRGTLNTILLNELEKTPNVKVFFNHKLTGADFKTNKAWFERRNPDDTVGTFKADSNQDDRSINVTRAPELEVPFDFLIGADGAHSATRFHLMKFTRMDYQQEYVDTLWCEFQIKASDNNDFRISPNHLHIWPGREFMFIALPSPDRSFTCTLFAPSAQYAALQKSPENLQQFFNTHFPGVSPELISLDSLTEQFMNNPHLPLISIKCSPHHFNSSVVILGDASHAVLPFYGQGLNAGLEDVRILFELLDEYGVYSPECMNNPTRIKEAREAALNAYTRQRVPDAHAINDLSRRNYIEMRWGVKSSTYLIRKAIEEALYRYAPGLGWSTQYARVSFGNQRYSEVERATTRQSQVLLRALAALLFSAAGLVGLWMWRWRRLRSLAASLIHEGLRMLKKN
ncbi:kynurenine 3-monooxygenase, mitochondrial precursor [Ophidiomyces ophidiicola]|nr:kynurenine 3-monooxygenase, mitochondrial precursor [Ophidiomyces ophidiicola]KAI1940417.1 kynurenine 3-monooxygenase, mitochondrial precursor [Ophidiomyces ophidiicola]